ncbi:MULTISPECIES: dienelactone hydrolase family protein [unclassified Devosia]|uniref:dienelactone hydrolase family protein n=1 Tax=unclassified Devosia TaxID=196773 RepID=UPI00086D6A7C|nr:MULTISPECIES: dienelactone hydrolase family protein [unclassified Devosia]MBN9363087.1 dienelactone hydrolase family protein [Devosia sp.]ODS92582.1 MAG: carboxymethylenebutenolidase [Devosia sp. SCN 66-27]OJX23413.1 MAG: carboxymethylenebutenolidase [Devosia sp. 66-14]
MDERDAPQISQEMINLFDDYTHLSLDRRKFMDNLAKLAGSMSAATVAATLMASNAKAQGLVPEDDARLVTEDVTYPGANGEMRGYLAYPAAGGPFGAVIVVHENRGLNAHTKDVARRVALEGFVALAPDFLSDLGGTPADEEAARPMFQQLPAGDVAANGVSTIAWLKTHDKSNGKVGAMGFCWGGGTVNNIATVAPDLLAAVPYYGGQPDAAAVPNIKAKLMAHYGGLDERINAGIPAFEAALKAAGTDYQIFIYEGANHAFNNDTSAARYSKEASDLAWSRTMALFRQVLA